jgi:hypothetical protein
MKQAAVPEPIKVLPVRSKEGRLFVEIDPRIERAGRIRAGEPLTLELIADDIVFHREPATGAGQSEDIER